ncbi:hypothetical protein [Ferruginibacter sp.]|uniref:hypothetical protein n=1 Tax=Ferruginibacter sp. TaxID=1940288 RepID=UPI00265AB080|nr:hypothetical protein [Ferruginibacter sp.]
MNQIKESDYVVFKNNILNVLTGNTPMKVQVTNGKTAIVTIFVGNDATQIDHEVACDDLELITYGIN